MSMHFIKPIVGNGVCFLQINWGLTLHFSKNKYGFASEKIIGNKKS